MKKKGKADSGNPCASERDQGPPSSASAEGVKANGRAEAVEQFLTEIDELRQQNLELNERTEEAERRSWALDWLARLGEEDPDPALRVSLGGTIQYRNPASLALCREWNTSDPLQVPPAIQELAAAAYADLDVLRREMVFGKCTYLITVAPGPSSAKYVNVFARDISARKQAEEALHELNATLEKKVAERTAQLEHRNRQLQKMTLEVSQAEERERKRMAEILHDDVQQILAAAKFHLALLRNRVQADASAQAIGVQIDAMLTEAIDKSRGLSHELSPAGLHRRDFNEVLGALATDIQVRHGLAAHVHAPETVLLRSDATAALLYRIAQELLFNVVKHARTTEARIRLRRHRQDVCLSVCDRGRGFDPQSLRQAAGYGLLSLRERIELLGGYVRVRSAPGRGTTVFVVVPDAETPQDTGRRTQDGRQATEDGRRTTEDRAYPSSVLGPPSSVLRVLLADDHRIVREGLRLLLSDEPDVEIVGEAAHGREAVDLALRLEPDVVIMDVSMPLIDGDAATRQIKTHRPQTRVIALSTYDEPVQRERMFRAGAEGYVLKTGSANELLAALRGKPAGSETRPPART